MTDNQKILHASTSEKIIQCLFAAYKELPYGLPVDFYKNGLAIEFEKTNLKFQKDFSIPVNYKGNAVGHLQVDFVVDKKIIVRVVSSDSFDKMILDEAKLFLRLSEFEVCLILNFGFEEAEHKRIIFTNNFKRK